MTEPNTSRIHWSVGARITRTPMPSPNNPIAQLQSEWVCVCTCRTTQRSETEHCRVQSYPFNGSEFIWRMKFHLNESKVFEPVREWATKVLGCALLFIVPVRLLILQVCEQFDSMCLTNQAPTWDSNSCLRNEIRINSFPLFFPFQFLIQLKDWEDYPVTIIARRAFQLNENNVDDGDDEDVHTVMHGLRQRATDAVKFTAIFPMQIVNSVRFSGWRGRGVDGKQPEIRWYFIQKQ